MLLTKSCFTFLFVHFYGYNSFCRNDPLTKVGNRDVILSRFDGYGNTVTVVGLLDFFFKVRLIESYQVEGD